MGRIWLPGGGGGGASSDDCTLMRAAVPAGMKAVTADSDDEAMEGTLNPDTTLADSQALSGQTFLKWNPQTKLFEKRTGGMANKGAWNGSVAMNGTVTIPAGYHNGSGKVTGPAITNRGNYGGTGNSRGNDAPNQRMWVKVPGGYYNENAQVFLNWADIRSMAGLTPDKIKKNVSIMGITGSFEGWVSSPLNLFNSGSWGGGQSGYTVVEGLGSYPGNSLSIKNGTIHITTAQSGGDNALLRLNNVGDLTNYKYLKIDSPYNYVWSGVGCGISKKSDITYLEGLDTYYCSPINSSTTSKGTHILDISKFTGTYWIYLYLGTGGNATREAGINKVYLTTN